MPVSDFNKCNILNMKNQKINKKINKMSVNLTRPAFLGTKISLEWGDSP